MTPARRVLVANRGEIACRIVETLHRMGLEAVAVYSDADRGAAHVRMADRAVRIGLGPAAESYLQMDRVVQAALETGSAAIHPGYGFMSEWPDFAEAVEDAQLAFVGPTPDQLRDFGQKHVARKLAAQAGVSLLPGSDVLASVDQAHEAAAAIGYPVMLKASAGGGGIGIRVCRDPDELAAAFPQVQRLATSSFGSGAVFVERFLPRARHVEVQVFGDGQGGVAVLGDRDCSVQRRNQKLVEEAPAPNLSDTTRQRLHADARSVATSVAYRSAGTVEFMVDADTGQHYFLEVNPRLQVEHGVTELVQGIDLVAWMVTLALDGPTAGAPWRNVAPPSGGEMVGRGMAGPPTNAARESRPEPGGQTPGTNGGLAGGWPSPGDAETRGPAHHADAALLDPPEGATPGEMVGTVGQGASHAPAFAPGQGSSQAGHPPPNELVGENDLASSGGPEPMDDPDGSGAPVAGGPATWVPTPRGHAVEVRVYAENPVRDFEPSAGRLTNVRLPEGEGIRCDGWVRSGTEVTPFYDPLLVKVLAHGNDRAEAVDRLDRALSQLRLDGIATNIDHLRAVLRDARFREAQLTTGLLTGVAFQPDAIEVVEASGNVGGETIVVSWPGRLGLWSVGVPPSGPMDDRSFRLGNSLLSNPDDAAGLECTVAGPTLRFHRPTTICVTGADMGATLEIGGEAGPVHRWEAVEVPAGTVLRLGPVEGPGARSYVLVEGGLDIPVALGSRTTFTLGGFGGHAGRALRPGDLLPLPPLPSPPLRASSASAVALEGLPAAPTTTGSPGVSPGSAPAAAPTGASADAPSVDRQGRSTSDTGRPSPATATAASGPRRDQADPTDLTATTTEAPRSIPEAERPVLGGQWEIGVVEGPHAAPDYLTEGDVELLYGTDWEVHYNSARTGVRLVGPRLTWARGDGGEAGLHPSNIHDNAYAVGTVDFTGDMPVILGPDGPSLGGFVCPATVTDAELWKVGQLKAGDTVRFIPSGQPPILGTVPGQGTEFWGRKAPESERKRPQIPEQTPGWLGLTFRRSGDRGLLVEVGPPVLDLDLRVRVHQLEEWLRAERVRGIVDLTPGIRSLQVQVDGAQLTVERAIDVVRRAESELAPVDDVVLPSRIVHLPLSWDDPAVRKAIEVYMRSVRDDAPWCPSNLEFIRRVNGLDSIDDVRTIAFAADYVVYGLGDVYLGAPVATPLDPRHRLVTTKYNPARTWTPENAVGIGGAYLCVYGMEGPGGYQFIGRTTPVWRRWSDDPDSPPWLLRFFDRIRFTPVDADELLELRAAAAAGAWEPGSEDGQLSVADHHRFLASIEDDAAAFRTRQQAAFAAERAQWESTGELAAADRAEASLSARPLDAGELEVPDGATVLRAPLAARVWSVAVADGAPVEADQVLVVLEAMKTETTIRTPIAGTVTQLCCAAGEVVAPGSPLAVVMPSGNGDGP